MNKKKGFTLVEVIVSIVLVSIVMVSLMASLTKLKKAYSKVNNDSDIAIYNAAISRILNNDVSTNNGIRYVICDVDADNCDLVLGSDEKRKLQILDKTNLTDATIRASKGSYYLYDSGNNYIREILVTGNKDNFATCNLKANCLKANVTKNGCTCTLEESVTSLKYTDSIANDKVLYLKTLTMEKSLDSNGNVISTTGYNFLNMSYEQFEYKNKENEKINDVLSYLAINIYDGIDPDNKTYNVNLYSSSRYVEGAAKTGDLIELTLNTEGDLSGDELERLNYPKAKYEENGVEGEFTLYAITEIYNNSYIGIDSLGNRHTIKSIIMPNVDIKGDKISNCIGYYTSDGIKVIDKNGNILFNPNYFSTNTKLEAKWLSSDKFVIHLMTLLDDDKNYEIYEENGVGWFFDSGAKQKISSSTNIFSTHPEFKPTKTDNVFGGYYDNTSCRGNVVIDYSGKLKLKNYFGEETDIYACWIPTSAEKFAEPGITVPYTPDRNGIYLIEVWGAQGGRTTYDSMEGGYGGFAMGTVKLKTSDTLYITVGEAGNDCDDLSSAGGYNGGGIGCTASGNYISGGGGGGGASHVALKQIGDGQLINYKDNLDDLLIVAGGGGGSYSWIQGGTGGGYYGGKNGSTPDKYAGQNTDANRFGKGDNASVRVVSSILFGKIKYSGGAGGGGLYGGYAITSISSSYKDDYSGTGGSGYLNNDKLIDKYLIDKDNSYEKHMLCHCEKKKNKDVCKNAECESSTDKATRTIINWCGEGNDDGIRDCPKRGDGLVQISLISLE